ncbi:MAG: DUF5674 family protein [Candidatus Portnoybacteria bacterium]|nr:DUF5674 family protein [Candidatus Portnoybacteria bacterium]MDD4982594.1 DUF5674 family protein [Candidatus Portnoybacteria bacterium]
MKIVENKITIEELKEMAQKMFGSLVKAVVDTEKEIMAVDGELHADLEVLLSESGSKRANLWGINIYPELEGDEQIEFDSMINLKPHLGNRTRGVEDAAVREKIIVIVNKLLTNDRIST